LCDYESSGGEEEVKKPAHVAMKAMSTTPEDEEPDEEELRAYPSLQEQPEIIDLAELGLGDEVRPPSPLGDPC
jgi:hypothetical protein